MFATTVFKRFALSRRWRAGLVGIVVVISVAILVGQTDGHQVSPAATQSIRLNSIGYPTNAPKLATVPGGTQGSPFIVRDVASGAQVYQGKLATLSANVENDDSVCRADFSDVRAAGQYQLELPGSASSAQFEIRNDVYNWPFYCAMKAMYLWRCGTAVECEIAGQKFGHAGCHLQDGYLDHAGGKLGSHKDGVGGWHDAGDYNKYTVNAAFTVGMLLRAWEDHETRLKSLKLNIPESGNAVPDFLDEVRWELDWLLKMQAADGSVYHTVSALNFCGYVMPEAEKEPRFFSSWSSAATADFTAVMAQASRAYRPFDAEFSDRCLAAAEKSYAFLDSHSDKKRSNHAAFTTGQYHSDDTDDRLWAAAELWEATGKPVYLPHFEKGLSQWLAPAQHAGSLVEDNWDWSDLRNLGMFTYIHSSHPGRNEALVASARRSLLTSASRIADTARNHRYGRPLGSTYFWGCNGTIARQAMNLNLAIRASATMNHRGNSQSTDASLYRATMLDGLNYLFGRNPFGRSFVTGLGYDPPRNPHDRCSIADGVKQPWPGYLVGGPWPKATDWHDDQEDFKTNEIAINWNGALIYSLAEFVEPATFDECVAKGNLDATRSAAVASETAQAEAVGK